MQAVNSAERSTSIITFIAVYVLLLIIPLYAGYMLGNQGKGTAVGDGGPEQKTLSESLINVQSYIDIMKKRDEAQATGLGTATLWEGWVADAKKEKDDFDKAIKQLTDSQFTGTRKDIKNSAVIYLTRLSVERAARIRLEENLHGVRTETSELQRLKAENESLRSAKEGLENTVRTKDQLITSLQKSSGGGGGSQNNEAVANLKWELLFCDANSQKAQADILTPCNQTPRRKQLYSVAKVNFKKITTGNLSSYTLKKLAEDKVREIDQLLVKL
ncbi:hypothetical protein [Spirosoma sp.]|uniref:hypothetical protein n=1 Tax=Spirosoma sp. TaxID=1899569 RepID=UPI0026386E3E|nr:hypothetical protein [Spirosoma sp.]MCX6216965.1 hypothetical protein [Spirosoma sp.]